MNDVVEALSERTPVHSGPCGCMLLLRGELVIIDDSWYPSPDMRDFIGGTIPPLL